MRLVLPTARSPTTLILSFRRRIRKAPASPLPASKALRDDYQRINSANPNVRPRPNGRESFKSPRRHRIPGHGLRRREDHVGPRELQGARLGRPRRDPEAPRHAAGDRHGPEQSPEPEQADPP